jgi:UDP-glucose 4-epimerase
MKEYANIVEKFADTTASGEVRVLFDDGMQPCGLTHGDDVVSFGPAADHELDGTYNVGTAESYDFNTRHERINCGLVTDIEPKYIATPLPATT